MADSVMRNYAISIFADGPKTETGTVYEIFSDNLVSFRLPNTCTVFQEQIYAIGLAARKIAQF